MHRFAPALALSLILASTLAAPGRAQETDTEMYDGRWTVSTPNAAGGWQPLARLTVADYAGTWTDLPSKLSGMSGRACRGKPFKITVQMSRPAGMEFMVWGSSVASECPDLRALLKPVDEKTLEGTLGGETKIRMQRR